MAAVVAACSNKVPGVVAYGSCALAAVLLGGCGPSGGSQAGPDAGSPPVVYPRQPFELGADPLEGLPRDEQQRQRLCERGYDDLLLDVACDGSLFEVDSLERLYALLDLNPAAPQADEGAVFTAHTTALSTRSVSAINPRAIYVRHPAGQPLRELLLVAFTRGEQIVEMAVRDRVTGRLRFYLLSYRQDCNAADDGCGADGLLTDATERGWSQLQLYDDTDLQNTVMDCAPCHQPSGPGTPPILRMFENAVPFTHWLWRHGPGGQALLADYRAAHGKRAYAGVPWERIYYSEPGLLASVMRLEGSGIQPRVFDGTLIELEVKQSAEGQPFDNRVPGQSETWQLAHEAALADDAGPLPYHDVKVTDPDRLALMVDAYGRYYDGELDDDALPDLRDVLPSDPERLAAMGLQPSRDLEGVELLHAACGRCHNGRLDPELSRARFDVADFDEGGTPDPTEVKRAIDRLMRDPREAGAMPPPRLLQIDGAQREELLRLLRRD